MSLISLKKQGHVAILTLERPEALNALNRQLLTDLNEALGQAEQDSEIFAMIVTGAGRAFAAGADISGMLNYTKMEGEAFSRLGNDVYRRLEKLPMPTIAAVNGFALGGGCEMAMACDIRLASEAAVFGLPEVGLGIPPGFGGTQRLARLIGPGRAKELVFTARNIKAAEALSVGLVQAVYPAEELMPEAEKLAAKIADQAPIAVRTAKRAIAEGITMEMDQAIVMEERCFGSCFETQDQRNGMAAFVEKRKHDPYVGA